MEWLCVATFSKPQDISDFERFLASREIIFRVSEEETEFRLWVQSESDAKKVAGLIKVYNDRPNTHGRNYDKRMVLKLLKRIPSVPITSTLIVTAIFLYVIQSMGFWGVISPFVFNHYADVIATNEWWRLFTPALLHGGFFHLFFNVIWIWSLGLRIEKYLGSKVYLLFVLAAGMFPNIAQYELSHATNFGGLSGIVYAFVGFFWVAGRLNKVRLLALPDALYVFMFIWLGLGSIGVIDMFMPSDISVANGAHWAGLGVGLVLAKMYLLSKKVLCKNALFKKVSAKKK